MVTKTPEFSKRRVTWRRHEPKHEDGSILKDVNNKVTILLPEFSLEAEDHLTEPSHYFSVNVCVFEMAAEMPFVPQSHKAVVYDKPGIISTKVVTLETPDPGPGEVLINLCVHFRCLLLVLIVLILQDTLWSMSLRLRSHDSCGS